jgi:hypothetical protein
MKFLLLHCSRLKETFMKRNIFPAAAYFAVLFLATLAVYHKPIFENVFDVLPYLGCIQLHETTDAAALHEAAYRDAKTHIPPADYATLIANANGYRQDLAANPWHFAETLSFYNGRFLFIEAATLLRSGFGIPALSAIVLVCSCAYLAIGTVLFLWLARYLKPVYAAPFALLLILSAPIMAPCRTPTPDAMSAAFVLLGLFFGIEMRSPFWCCLLLLLSIYVRTDNVILAAALLFSFAFLSEKDLRIGKLHAAALLALAAASVIAIDRSTGNYGWTMLFHNTFVSAITTPAETVAQLSLKDYVAQFASGAISKSSSMMLFILMGAIGLFASWKLKTCGALRDLGAILFVVMAFRYALFPSFLDRHYAAFYIVWAVLMLTALANVLGIARTRTQQSPSAAAFRVAGAPITVNCS